MNKSPYTFEIDRADRKWLQNIRNYAIPCPGEISPDFRIFDPRVAKARSFVVAPFLSILDPGEPRFIEVLKRNSIERVFLATFPDDEETLGSAEIDGDSIWAIMAPCLRHCLLVPRNESFFIFSCQYDYWMIIGPRPLVEDLAGVSLCEAFSQIRKELEKGNIFDPPDEFFANMLALYERHNEEVQP